jgi:hypothetical protein
LTQRVNGQRDYAPSVLYDDDKVIYIGGGSRPTANAELLDMSQPQPTWQPAAPMSFPRRQHNATILPDGTVSALGAPELTRWLTVPIPCAPVRIYGGNLFVTAMTRHTPY